MTVDRLNECKCSMTTAYDDCPVHGSEDSYDDDYCSNKYSQRETSHHHYSQNMPWINVTSSLIGVSLNTDGKSISIIITYLTVDIVIEISVMCRYYICIL